MVEALITMISIFVNLLTAIDVSLTFYIFWEHSGETNHEKNRWCCCVISTIFSSSFFFAFFFMSEQI